MRIALVIKTFDKHVGGAEHWTWQFARWLAAAGHNVHVVASRFSADTAALGISAHCVPPLRRPTAWATAAEEVLRRLRVDVIHDMGHGWYCDVLQPHGGSRVASFEQNLLLIPPWLRPVKRGLARCWPRYREFDRVASRQYVPDGRRVIALSRMVAGHMARHYPLAPQQVQIIYNGVDTQRFSPEICRPHRAAARHQLGLRDETLLLLVTQNLRLKGVPTALRALARLRRAGHAVRLVVAGGKGFRGYQRMAQRLSIGGAVTFAGQQEDVIPYYAAADIYVHPTFYDPCSLVLLEAMACGLPVITSRFNGAGELVRPGQDGYVISDPADDKELANRVASILKAGECQRMGRAARQQAEAHPWERNCREIVSLYQELAGRRQAA
jgi:UDP-glucose:(heptosyl)LPS alpha-1,3-glucosyltransferase